MKVVELKDFMKIMVDWIVDNDIGRSEDPMTSIQKHPVNDENGDIYFFNPMRVLQEDITPSDALDKLEIQLDFALTEIFNYYSRSYTHKPKSFDNYHDQLFTMNLHQFMQFIKDMEIPIDKPRAVEVYKKSATNHMPFAFDEFKGSLTRLAVASNKYRLETNNKKLSQLKATIEHVTKGKPLPLNLRAYENVPQLNLMNQRHAIETENGDLNEMKDKEAYKNLTEIKIGYLEPSKYRSRIPGYREQLNLQQVNIKQAKKIIQVKKNNSDGLQTIGGASGITSMLSRGHESLNTKRTTFSHQQNSVNRLYK